VRGRAVRAELEQRAAQQVLGVRGVVRALEVGEARALTGLEEHQRGLVEAAIEHELLASHHELLELTLAARLGRDQPPLREGAVVAVQRDVAVDRALGRRGGRTRARVLCAHAGRGAHEGAAEHEGDRESLERAAHGAAQPPEGGAPPAAGSSRVATRTRVRIS
jgi:hypothetical protein